MACEIERKYLVDTTRWKPSGDGAEIVQGYIFRSMKLSIRLRMSGECAFLTIKGAASGFSCSEFEYPIPLADARAMLDEFSDGTLVCKTRYLEKIGSHIWEVDIFEGANQGLAVAEIELDSEDETFELPGWVTTEVTGDKRYNNTFLAENPYSCWK